VLVTRVHGLVGRKECERRYHEINDFERMLTANGVTILKFFLHVSRAEQARRLAERLSDPKKNWKYNAGDLAERALWPRYTSAYVDALSHCSTEWAPWYVVPADDKASRNLLIARTIADTLIAMHPVYPKATREVLAAARRRSRHR
jgi:polyphosphate kinase 2 (PPK2 family)